MAFISFQLPVHLVCALPEQEQATKEQDEITSRDFLAGDREERSRKSDYPRNREQEENPDEHRKAESDLPGLRPLRLRKLAGENGYENDVVDAEDDLERRQGR
jgi:hypothetical protein